MNGRIECEPILSRMLFAIGFTHHEETQGGPITSYGRLELSKLNEYRGAVALPDRS
jgi:hypothetical protein